MQIIRADLHIHTVLSPCADLEMTPKNIVSEARDAGLRLIGITDHNSTKNAALVKTVAEKAGIYVLLGAEITTKEEVHCLAFFEHQSELNHFQEYLDEHILKIPNPDGHFGYQPVVDANENIVEMIPHFLSAAVKKSIAEIQQKVFSLNGIFIPAHVSRPANGLFAQLGFIPPGLRFHALGISSKSTTQAIRKDFGLPETITLVYNSDAHFPGEIGQNFSVFHLEELSFYEVKMALNQQNNRFVEER